MEPGLSSMPRRTQRLPSRLMGSLTLMVRNYAAGHEPTRTHYSIHAQGIGQIFVYGISAIHSRNAASQAGNVSPNVCVNLWVFNWEFAGRGARSGYCAVEIPAT